MRFSFFFFIKVVYTMVKRKILTTLRIETDLLLTAKAMAELENKNVSEIIRDLIKEQGKRPEVMNKKLLLEATAQ